MAQGPILIFDKSTLESLNPDETVWLDNFFMTNITPLFFVETLADLEKQMRSGRTPEEVVGNLAYKTPDMQSSANVHHLRLLEAELYGAERIAMEGWSIISGGTPVTLGGKTGIVFKKAPKEEALHRWQRHQFLDLERLIAKNWRRALSNVNYDGARVSFQKWFASDKKPKTLSDVKALADARIDGANQENSLQFGLTLLGVAPEWRKQVLTRWRDAGRPTIREFAPYFRFVFSIDVFFYLAIAADLISERPSNKVDVAYLYYLPFCRIFSSGDRLHERTVPLFLRENQTFVRGADLKTDLGKLDQHYSLLPKDVTDRGLFHFADCPPTDSSFLVTRLWDKHLPAWRTRPDKPREPISEAAQRALLDLVNRVEKEALPADPAIHVSTDKAEYVQMHRSVYFQKGKWKRFPPEVKKKAG